jgi:glutamyl-tRNA synthetase
VKLHGTYVLLRYIGRVATLPNFYGKNAYESGQVVFFEFAEYKTLIRVIP